MSKIDYLTKQIQQVEKQLEYRQRQQEQLKIQNQRLFEELEKAKKNKKSNSKIQKDNLYDFDRKNQIQIEKRNQYYTQLIQSLDSRHNRSQEIRKNKIINCQNALKKYKQLYEILNGKNNDNNQSQESFNRSLQVTQSSKSKSHIQQQVIYQMMCSKCQQSYRPNKYFAHIQFCKQSYQYTFTPNSNRLQLSNNN